MKLHGSGVENGDLETGGETEEKTVGCGYAPRRLLAACISRYECSPALPNVKVRFPLKNRSKLFFGNIMSRTGKILEWDN